MQDATDTELAVALDNPSVVMRPVIEVDWDRDGNYANTYSDLSSVCGTVDLDTAEIKGDLPDEINTVAGASSGKLTVTLHGRRSSDEYRVPQLLAKHFTASPLYSIVKEGAPIRLSVRVQTTAGWKTLTQFTGWIVDYITNEDDDEVVLNCSDVHDLQHALVTLPLWAVGPSPDPSTAYDTTTGLASVWRPMDTTWLYDEILRQGGRGIGPAPRSDCIAYWTCNGSFLPSVGSMAELQNCAHRISWEHTDAWTVGGYGLIPKSIIQGEPDYLSESKGEIRTTAPVYVPANGGTADTIYVAMGTWVVSNGNPTAQTIEDPSYVYLAIDSGYVSGPGRMMLWVWDNGEAFVEVKDSEGASGEVNRVWNFSTPLAAGSHYLNARATFTETGVTMEFRVDDTILTPTSTNIGSGGFRYVQGLHPDEVGNVAHLVIQMAPLYHAQIYTGSSAATYDPNQKLPPISPATATLERTMTELAWLPDIKQKIAWDVLREAVAAEFGVLYTDEWGVVHFVRRDTVWYGSGPGSVTVRVIPRGKMKGISAQPSAQTYRNTISISSTYRVQDRAIVFQNGDPLQFYVKNGETRDETFPLKDVVAIQARVTSISATPVSTGANIRLTSVATVRANDITLAAPDGWGAGVDWAYDQRSIGIAWSSGTSGYDCYVGCYLNGNQAAFLVGGQRYSTQRVNRTMYSNSTEVDAKGVVLLEIPDSQWRQTDPVSSALATSLLRDLIYAIPTISDLSIAPDPRLQLLDVVELPDAETITGTVRFQILGKKLRFQSGTFEQKLTLRALPR
jgi:hypothetical protein